MAIAKEENNNKMKKPDLEKPIPNPRDERRWLTMVVCLGCLILLLVVGGIWYSNSSDEGEYPWLLLIILLIPPGFQILGLWETHRKLLEDESVTESRENKSVEEFFWFYMRWMPTCLGSYSLMWLLYAGSHYFLLGQCLSLIFICVLVIPVLGMTYTIMESSERGQTDAGIRARGRTSRFVRRYILLENIKESASNVPYWTLLFFFTMFLVVVYLFSFAFAFHDKAIQDNRSQQSTYKITDQALEILETYRVPQGYIEKLRKNIEREFPGEKNFRSFLDSDNGSELTSKARSLILHVSLKSAPTMLPALYTPKLYTSNADEEQMLQIGPVYKQITAKENSVPKAKESSVYKFSVQDKK